ncbi:stage III sporulation protein AF [Peribacillus asahii]|uniref:Stage III sporulation protein AF n=1 Tax=Peribacillus asahii TaxID=228899 RepID=A0A398BGB1_9BACI|nr:stage III sporulation protein AF [Peribacillus asahii]RID89365.1 stage III sporulation protein AF [Peribacillus asahii]
MDFLASWISNIIIFILLATVIDMLLPNSALQKYSKMVIGLLLIAVIITPILRLLHTNFDDVLASATIQFEQGEAQSLGNLTESKKKEIQAAQSAYILEQMAVQLQAEAEEELMEKYQMEIQDIEVTVKDEEKPEPENLQHITVSLSEVKEDETIEAIAKVEIDTKRALVTDDARYADVKQFLANTWSIDEEMIQIAGERRD